LVFFFASGFVADHEHSRVNSIPKSRLIAEFSDPLKIAGGTLQIKSVAGYGEYSYLSKRLTGVASSWL
jgi:hypothetical protein